MPNHEKPPKMREPYSTWKLELELWEEATDYKENQIGPIVALSLEGDARDAALSIPKDTLKSKDGLNEIIKKLDSMYKKDETQLAYLSLDQFFKFRRPLDMDMNEFLRKFELMKNKCATHKLNFDDGVLAYFMIECANLPADKVDIVKATMKDLSTTEVKGRILSIYTDISSKPQSSQMCSSQDNTLIKQEQQEHYSYPQSPLLLAQNAPTYSRGRGRGSNYPARQSYDRYESYHGAGPSTSYSDGGPMYNAVDPTTGMASTCTHCGSWYHWRNKCPDAPSAPRGGFNRKRGNHRGRGGSRRYNDNAL